MQPDGPLPLVIAHRGDSAHRPENTLAAFQSALEAGATMIELDVHLTRDGHVVVIHDTSLDRTTTGSGDVAAHTLQEIKAVSAGYPELFGDAYAGERVPTLAEALAFLKGRARIMLEMKSGGGKGESGLEEHTIAEVRRAGMTRAVALISFDRQALLRCRELAPDITRGHLFYEATLEEIVAGAREAGCELVMPHKHLLNEDLAERLRSEGFKLATWVVDDPVELRELRRFGVFGVGSNRPGVLLDALEELSASSPLPPI